MVIHYHLDQHFEEVEQMLAHFRGELEAELREANRRIAPKVNADAKRLLELDVYNVPIPLTIGAHRSLSPNAPVRSRTTKGQHGQWTRTGTLLRNETWRFSTDGLTITLENATQYAHARATLGTPESRRRAGVQRPQTNMPPEARSQTLPVGDWQKLAVQHNRDFIAAEYRAAIERAVHRVKRR